ncbi:hypothetical protein Pcinc_011477 [Petrolisthes cinctipes]|uniref:Transposase n=1 Tax=Petrolisthes cinctipes TaxID=88211 RepID=A0AAE1G2J6_PETCI|nr:hypothetical protein Pcinc_011477 [Petrolisthes cinctipes]
MDRQSEKVAQRGRIVGMKEGGLSAAEIAAEFGLHRATVYSWLRRWEEDGELRDGPRSGVKRKTTPQDDQRIREYAETHPFGNAVDAQQNLNLDLSVQTVRNRLKEMGYHHRTPSKKLKLTERHRQLRVQFAQRYLDYGLDNWGKVIFFG